MGAAGWRRDTLGLLFLLYYIFKTGLLNFRCSFFILHWSQIGRKKIKPRKKKNPADWSRTSCICMLFQDMIDIFMKLMFFLLFLHWRKKRKKKNGEMAAEWCTC